MYRGLILERLRKILCEYGPRPATHIIIVIKFFCDFFIRYNFLTKFWIIWLKNGSTQLSSVNESVKISAII